MVTSPGRAARFLVLAALVPVVVTACSDRADEARRRADGANREAAGEPRKFPDPRTVEDLTFSPDVTKSVPVAYDKNSVRFVDDQLVIDLVLTNRTPHTVLDAKLKLECPADNGRGEWRAQREWAEWPPGREQRVVVPLLNNDLDIEEREEGIGPKFEYTIKGTVQTAGGRRDVIATNSEGPVRTIRVRIPGVGTPPIRDTWKGHLTGGTSHRPGDPTKTLRLKRESDEIPALVQVQLLVVGYSQAGEVFRKRVTREEWMKPDEWLIEVPAGELARLRFRGVGKRRITNADDLDRQQVYYICENWVMKSAK